MKFEDYFKELELNLEYQDPHTGDFSFITYSPKDGIYMCCFCLPKNCLKKLK